MAFRPEFKGNSVAFLVVHVYSDIVGSGIIK